jgi:hypothetical protein
MSTDTVAQQARRLAVRQNKAFIVIGIGHRPIMQYRYDCVPYKPYVRELFTPAGVQVLRDAPADHWHHHGVMFAIGVNNVSFWTEWRAKGRQVQRSLDGPQLEQRDGLAVATIKQGLDWLVSEEERPVLAERRELSVYAGAGLDATLLTWRSELTTPREQVTLGGSHYYGLGLRFAQRFDRIGRIVNATDEKGELVRGDERLFRVPWSAYVVAKGERPITVAMFDHPSNPRHPAVMFTMTRPFAFLSATLNLWRDPLVLKRDQKLTLTYGVAAWDGAVEKATIAMLYDRWVRLIKATYGPAERRSQ